MSDEPRDPQLEGLLDLVVEICLSRIHCSMPATIVEYDAARQAAVVQPLIKVAHLDEVQARVPQVLPVIHSVPVAHLGGAGGRITVPVHKGDTGMLWFASVSIARWKLRGGIVDPGDDRRHDLSDCVFYPGGHDFAHVPTTAPTDAIVTHGATRLGDPMATDDKYKVAILDTMRHFMTVLDTVADAAGACAALHTALAAVDWPDAFVATLVKAK